MLLRVNESLASKPAKVWPDKVRGKPLQKAKEHGLYLGLNDYAWVDLLGAC